MLSAGLSFESRASARSASGLVGPNAVTQLEAALRSASGPRDATQRIFASAGLLRMLQVRPEAMIDEAIPGRLFEALWRELPATQAAWIARDAGRRTGAYVLQNRIPRLVRAILHLLPERIAAKQLLKSVQRHAWTFAGSGICEIETGPRFALSIANNPLEMPGGAWHVGVLEHLYQALVNPRVKVRHVSGRIGRLPADRFEIEMPERDHSGESVTE